jgi:hypothetical protein
MIFNEYIKTAQAALRGQINGGFVYMQDGDDHVL